MNPMKKKSSLAKVLMVAGALAAGAGLAQAQTYDVPQQAGEASTMTHGQPNLLTNNVPHSHYSYTVTHPHGVTISSAPVVQSWYYPDGSSTHMTTSTHVLGAGPAVLAAPVHSHHGYGNLASATETSNTPERAGEMSTMTGGAPNVLTNNAGVAHAGTLYYYGY